MKKPILTTLERYSLREHPNSFLASFARMDIEKAKFRREFYREFILPIVKFLKKIGLHENP